MSARWPLAGAGVAIAAVTAWYALRDSSGPTESSRNPPVPATDLRAPRADAAVAIRQPRPLPPTIEVADAGVELAGADDAAARNAAADTGADAFARESRDPAWASDTEQQIRRTLDRQPGARLQGVECRARQCRLDYTGTETEISDTMAAFERAAGLRTLAQTVTLGLERAPDGTMQLQAFAAIR